MITGNKGGVGKSLFCLALASALEKRDELFAVLDGDGRTGDVHASFLHKHPSRWADFRELRPESHTCPQDAVYEERVHALLSASQHLIINTPDGADSLLMKWFDMTLRHTESNNCQFRMMYLMSDRPDGLTVLPDMATRFLALYPIRNLHFGNEDRFAVYGMDHESKFHSTLDFPVLRGDEVRLLFDAHTYPYEAIRAKTHTGRFRWPALSRARIGSWQNKIDTMLEPVFVARDHSNIDMSAGDEW